MQHVKNILMKKISKIKKINNKYTIILSDNSSLSFYSDTLIKYNLLKPREISDKELEEVINYNNYIEAYNKALTYISYKQRTKKEIKDKLCNYSIDVIDKVIKKLDELCLLDEKKYIEAFINDQINLCNKGPFYIKKELKKLNINIDYIDEILNNKNKFIWTTKVSNKGQIVIPKEAREIFNINEGDTLIMFGDIEKGIAIAKYDDYLNFAQTIFNARNKENDND